MHIPKGASQTCALLTFDDALHCSQHDDYDAARWLYVPPYYTEYRYILGTRGENPLICIGINPSTAQPGDLDNTLKSVERIALGNGYDSFTMFNVYPQRATDPNAWTPPSTARCTSRTWRRSATCSGSTRPVTVRPCGPRGAR